MVDALFYGTGWCMVDVHIAQLGLISMYLPKLSKLVCIP
jgi:hypothetical protein